MGIFLIILILVASVEAAPNSRSLTAPNKVFSVPEYPCGPIDTTQPTLSESRISANITNLKEKFLNPAAPHIRIHWTNVSGLATLGDSISAGLFVQQKVAQLLNADSLVENRPESWSSGGAPGRVTLFNIARILHQTVDILGGSRRPTKRLEVSSDPEIGLNMAVSGARIRDAPGQVERMLAAMRNLPEEQDDQWLMVNFFFGSNDMCMFCDEESGADSEPSAFETFLRQTLEKLRRGTNRRLLLQIYGALDISQVPQIVPTTCNAVRKAGNVCRCLFRDESNREKIHKLFQEINGILERVSLEYQENYLKELFARKGQDPSKVRFMVFYQPILGAVNVQDFGLRVLSEIDCFHPNESGQTMLSVLAYQSMQSSSKDEKLRHYQSIKASVKPSSNGVSSGSESEEEKTEENIVDKLVNAIFKRASVVQPIDWTCPSANSFIQ
jgi:hypothetical protein